MKYSDICSYNAYLLHVLQKRSIELKAAYQHIVQLDHQIHNQKADSFVRVHLETDDIATQTLQSCTVACDECCILEETAQNLKQQLSDSVQAISNRDSELAELKKQLADSVSLISELRAQADAEEAARKVKEELVEELEELVMVCKSETLATEQEQRTVIENWSRENESLKCELNSLSAILQTKEAALAQSMLEKDDLEDVNARLQVTSTSLQHQLDELQLETQNQNSHFEGQIQCLADEKQQLMEKLQSLNMELTKCQQSSSVPFGCSQPLDFIASQQSNELSSIKLELLAVQAEKEDLIQQLHQCKTELSSLQFRSCQSNQSVQDPMNNAAGAPASTKPSTTTSSREELESQNAALLGQLLILEDQLSESETLLQESRNGHQQDVEQLKTALKELADLSTRTASFEQEKLQLETELNAAKMKSETCEARLQECETHLSLVEGKLSSAGNRQRQLLCQKQSLESQNRELSHKLQMALAATAQPVGSPPSCRSNNSHPEDTGCHVEVAENRVPSANKLYVTARNFQQSGNQQMSRNVTAIDATGKHWGKLFGVTASDDCRPVPRITSATALMGVCEAPTSVCTNTVSSLKRSRVEYPTEIGTSGKRHVLYISNQQVDGGRSDSDSASLPSDVNALNSDQINSNMHADDGVELLPLKPVDNVTTPHRRAGGRPSLSLSRRSPKMPYKQSDIA